MTSKGSLFTQFRRALDAGNTMTAYELARELPRVSLEDALSLCLLLAAEQDRRYEPAARRWLERFATERRPSLDAWAVAGSALAELGCSPHSQGARDTLKELLHRA